MQRYTIDEIYAKKKKIENRQKVKKIIMYIIIIPLILYNLIILFQVFAKSNTTPNVLGHKTFVIISGSMVPELQIGDIAVVKNVEKSELKVGDVISFREGNTVTTHRISGILEDGKYKTKGDANNADDTNPVEYANIEGKLAFSIPKIGYLVILVQNKVGIIVVGILIYIMYIINKNGLEKKNKRNS